MTYLDPSEIDPNFTDFGYTISANLQEIRRERRAELALQGFRLDDLMRWRAHKLIQGNVEPVLILVQTVYCTKHSILKTQRT